MTCEVSNMTNRRISESARVGHWIEERGIDTSPSRRGQIIELVGSGRHERYRVRWDEQHESIVYPADGVLVIPARGAAHPGR
jgi:hypothetical protein